MCEEFAVVEGEKVRVQGAAGEGEGEEGEGCGSEEGGGGQMWWRMVVVGRERRDGDSGEWRGRLVVGACWWEV